MKVVVFSSTQFGYRCIREAVLAADDVTLTGILTTPRRIQISHSPGPMEICSHAQFNDLGDQAGCEVAVQDGPFKRSHYLERLDRWQPDLILALGWYYNIPRQVREVAARGCLGIHASLLPKYRGGAPINWAILRGEAETGVSLFHLEDEIDAGDIVAQSAFPISRDDTCATVYAKAENASVDILREILPRLSAGTATRTPQDHRQATIFPQRRPEDGQIDWSWPAEQIRDFIRAQTHPYPGAFFFAGGKKITIWDADVVDIESSDEIPQAMPEQNNQATVR